MPKISVVCAAYNCESTIKDTIDGITNQTFPDWELVIVNDKSIDNTWNLITELAKKDSRIKLFSNQHNMGFAFTRDRAIREATGEIIAINDSDDVSYPNRLEKIASAFNENPSLDIFYSNVDYYYPDTEERRRRFFQPFNNTLIKQIDFVPDPGAAFRKEVYVKLGGYDTKIKLGADYDLWLRAEKAGMNFSYTEEALSQYTKHPNALTAQASPEAIKNRQYWNQYVRVKNGLTKINPKIVEELAESDVIDFYLRKNFEVWFGSGSLPIDNQELE